MSPPTLGGMSHASLMLVARATEALPGFTAVRVMDASTDQMRGALIEDTEGVTWLVELPRTQDEESAHRDRILAARSIGEGLRSRLPFGVPRIAGHTDVRGRTLTVSPWLPGERPRATRLAPDLVHSIARSLAALHQIPASALYDQGRPIHSALESMRLAAQVVDRAATTTLLPQALLRRWEAAYEDTALWHFEPTIVHGAMHLGSILHEGSRVSAITGWRQLQVGDPAKDLAWLTGPTMKDTLDIARPAYLQARPDADRHLFQRARFWAELDIARWLLHGLETRDDAIVDEATDLIHSLNDRVTGDLEHTLTEPITQQPHPLAHERPRED